ncbi:ABC transporter ATP-binding protein [Bacillales bacterium AN1005]
MIRQYIEKCKLISSITVNTFKTMNRVSPFYTILTITFTIIKGVSPLLFIILTERTINSLISSLESSNFSFTPFFYVFLQFSYLVFQQLINHIEKIINFRMFQKMEFYFNNEVFNICISIPLIYYDDIEYYNSLNKATMDIGKRSSSYLQEVLSLIQSTITFISFFMALFVVHWIIAIFLLLIICILIWINIYTSQTNYSQFLEQILKNRKIEYLESLFKSKEVAKELRIFNHGNFVISKWKYLFWQVGDDQYKLEKRNNNKIFGVSILHFIFNLIFLSLLCFYVLSKKITIGKFVALSQVLNNSINISHQIASSLGSIYRDSLSINDYYQFRDMVPKERWNENLLDNPLIEPKNIVVENISFSYPNHDYLVLKNVSFQIVAGKKVAIVGRNGSGKSTLVKCLTGLYSTKEGNVLINGMPITPYIRDKYFSAIFQDFFKYEMSIQENVTLSEQGNNKQLENLNWVVSKSGTNKLLKKYNLGYDDFIGSTLYGRELSGGEWQKIALSRALFKNSPIIILDEPTAALDPISESKIIDDFLDISLGKTSIFVTHRLGSCLNADVILVMKDGELVEQGNHEELIQLNGEYAELFNMQAKWYKEKRLGV